MPHWQIALSVLTSEGYPPIVAYEFTWPEYLVFLIGKMPPKAATDDVGDVKSRMRKQRAEKVAESAR